MHSCLRQCATDLDDAVQGPSAARVEECIQAAQLALGRLACLRAYEDLYFVEAVSRQVAAIACKRPPDVLSDPPVSLVSAMVGCVSRACALVTDLAEGTYQVDHPPGAEALVGLSLFWHLTVVLECGLTRAWANDLGADGFHKVQQELLTLLRTSCQKGLVVLASSNAMQHTRNVRARNAALERLLASLAACRKDLAAVPHPSDVKVASYAALKTLCAAVADIVAASGVSDGPGAHDHAPPAPPHGEPMAPGHAADLPGGERGLGAIVCDVFAFLANSTISAAAPQQDLAPEQQVKVLKFWTSHLLRVGRAAPHAAARGLERLTQFAVSVMSQELAAAAGDPGAARNATALTRFVTGDLVLRVTGLIAATADAGDALATAQVVAGLRRLRHAARGSGACHGDPACALAIASVFSHAGRLSDGARGRFVDVVLPLAFDAAAAAVACGAEPRDAARARAAEGLMVRNLLGGAVGCAAGGGAAWALVQEHVLATCLGGVPRASGLAARLLAAMARAGDATFARSWVVALSGVLARAAAADAADGASLGRVPLGTAQVAAALVAVLDGWERGDGAGRPEAWQEVLATLWRRPPARLDSSSAAGTAAVLRTAPVGTVPAVFQAEVLRGATEEAGRLAGWMQKGADVAAGARGRRPLECAAWALAAGAAAARHASGHAPPGELASLDASAAAVLQCARRRRPVPGRGGAAAAAADVAMALGDVPGCGRTLAAMRDPAAAAGLVGEEEYGVAVTVHGVGGGGGGAGSCVAGRAYRVGGARQAGCVCAGPEAVAAAAARVRVATCGPLAGAVAAVLDGVAEVRKQGTALASDKGAALALLADALAAARNEAGGV
ncbi:unnamed protein product [Pedinophyceae sp. YPF-701]|nr:unnamed protein product [Pedinophyceae sp. YPF-701]